MIHADFLIPWLASCLTHRYSISQLAVTNKITNKYYTRYLSCEKNGQRKGWLSHFSQLKNMLTGLHLQTTTHKGEKGTLALSNRVDPHNAVLYPSDSIKYPNLQHFVRGTASQYQRELSVETTVFLKGRLIHPPAA